MGKVRNGDSTHSAGPFFANMKSMSMKGSDRTAVDNNAVDVNVHPRTCNSLTVPLPTVPVISKQKARNSYKHSDHALCV